MEIKRMMMSEDFNVDMEIRVDNDEWHKYLRTVSDAILKEHHIPNSPLNNNVPLSAALNVYGDDILNKASREAANNLFRQVCISQNFAPVSKPSITVTSYSLDFMEFKADFVTYPIIDDYTIDNITVEKPIVITTEDEVDAAIEEYMARNLWVHEVPRCAQIGDIVELSFSGTHEGQRFQYDHTDKCRFTMGSHQLFAGLDEALVGHVAGDDLDLTLTMPEDFHRKEIQGFTLDLKVHLRGVWARERRECTDEYVRDFIHDSRVNTVSEFRDMQRKKIQERHDRHCNEAFENRCDNALANTVSCKIPEPMLETALNNYIEALQQLAAQQGKSVDQVLAEENKTMDIFKNMCRHGAEMQVRQSIAIDHIIRVYNLQISQNEFDAHLKHIASLSKISTDEALQRAGGQENVIESMLNKKAREFFKSRIKIIETPMKSDPKE